MFWERRRLAGGQVSNGPAGRRRSQEGKELMTAHRSEYRLQAATISFGHEPPEGGTPNPK
jgi:hypothetical protein